MVEIAEFVAYVLLADLAVLQIALAAALRSALWRLVMTPVTAVLCACCLVFALARSTDAGR